MANFDDTRCRVSRIVSLTSRPSTIQQLVAKHIEILADACRLDRPSSSYVLRVVFLLYGGVLYLFKHLPRKPDSYVKLKMVKKAVGSLLDKYSRPVLRQTAISVLILQALLPGHCRLDGAEVLIVACLSVLPSLAGCCCRY